MGRGALTLGIHLTSLLEAVACRGMAEEKRGTVHLRNRCMEVDIQIYINIDRQLSVGLRGHPNEELYSSWLRASTSVYTTMIGGGI